MATPKKPATPHRKRGKKRPRTDWHALKVEYAAGSMSLRALAAERDVDERTLMNHSASDGWDAARTAHRVASAAKVAEVKVEWRAKTEAELHRIGHDIMLDLLSGASKMAADMKGGGTPQAVKATVEAVTLAIKTARQTAGLPAEPTGPAPGTTSTGDTVIRRTAPDGSTVVVTVAAPTP